MEWHERLMLGIAAVNFIVFAIATVAWGGDAVNGTSQDGRYFLGQRGLYTEVSRPVYIFSMVHTLSLLITQPLAIWAGFRARNRAREQRLSSAKGS